MDLQPFELSESARTLLQAGVRLVLRPDAHSPGSLLSGKLPSLPEPWAALLAKTPRESLCIWTYFDLGADLGGQPHAGRSALWRELIGHLRFPRGSIGFWPYTGLVQGNLQPFMEYFFSGLQSLRTKALVVFGEAPFYSSLYALNSQEVSESDIGLPVYFAPLPEELLTASVKERLNLSECLRAFFTNLPPDP